MTEREELAGLRERLQALERAGEVLPSRLDRVLEQKPEPGVAEGLLEFRERVRASLAMEEALAVTPLARVPDDQPQVIDGRPGSAALAELRRLLKDALPWLELLGSVGPIPSAPDDPDRAELQRVIQLIRLEVTP